MTASLMLSAGAAAAGGKPAQTPAAPTAAAAAEAAPAVTALKAFLANSEHRSKPMAELLPKLGESWATAPLTSAEAWAAARALLTHEHAAQAAMLKAQWDAREIAAAGTKMKFTVKRFGTAAAAASTGGEKPARWPLYISMHGGGSTTARTNDQQYQNQINLYQPADGLYIAPRAPTDTWNMWHQAHMDALLTAMILAAVTLDNVDPDRVYLMGYSAGGDGVYQLAPRMADHFAAAAMMAGHPNDASPLGLRNLPFAIQVGANDNAFDRANIARKFGETIAKLHEADPEGYISLTKIHEGKGHWMDRQDALALPWMAEHTRNLWANGVVWKQSSVTHNEFYWLALPPNVKPVAGSLVMAERDDDTVTLSAPEPAGSIPSLTIYLRDPMPNLNEPVTVKLHGSDKPLFTGTVSRTIAAAASAVARRADYATFMDVPVAAVTVKLPEAKAVAPKPDAPAAKP
jgi:hypothetical protein